MPTNSFSSRAHLAIGSSKIELYRLDALVKANVGDVATLPYSLRILLENLLRYEDGKTVTPTDVQMVAGWDPKKRVPLEAQVACGGGTSRCRCVRAADRAMAMAMATAVSAAMAKAAAASAMTASASASSRGFRRTSRGRSSSRSP